MSKPSLSLRIICCVALVLAHACTVDVSTDQVSRDSSALRGQQKETGSMDPNPPSLNYRETPPFPPQEFWGKVLLLLGKRGGYAAKEDIDAAFNIRLRAGSSDDLSTISLLAKGDEWYIGVRHEMTTEKFTMPPGPGVSGWGGRLSVWDLWWNDDSKKLYTSPDFGWCIPADKVTPEIIRLGWMKTSENIGRPPEFTEFYRNDKRSFLRIIWGPVPVYVTNTDKLIGYGGRCVYRITVIAEP